MSSFWKGRGGGEATRGGEFLLRTGHPGANGGARNPGENAADDLKGAFAEKKWEKTLPKQEGGIPEKRGD